MKLLAVSGSLRAASSNSRLIEALALVAPASVAIDVFHGLGDLPHFNPDLDDERLPPAVADWRCKIGQADGLVICSPEYAHGVAGVMKNALDWLVPSLEFPGMPVCLLNAAPHAHHAQAHIRETLSVMSARIVEPACVAAPLQGRPLAAQEIAADPELSDILRRALDAFLAAIRRMEPTAFRAGG